MSHRPSNPDASSADDGASPFGGLGAGLGMFQSWMKAASSAMPNLGGQGTSASSNWTMPTLDPEELDKRIQDLKTVQFWLEQNARMIGMTIQTLEVQRMTLNTLREMKVPVDALRDVLKASHAAANTEPPSQPSASAPTAESAPEPSAAEPSEGAVNPMAWWSTLTEQFTHLATQAVNAGQEAMSPQPVPDKATSAAAKPAAKRAKSATRKTAPRSQRAGSTTAAKKVPPSADR